MKFLLTQALQLKPTRLGSPVLEIQLGGSTTYLKTGDTIQSVENPGMLGAISNKLGPLIRSAYKNIGNS